MKEVLDSSYYALAPDMRLRLAAPQPRGSNNELPLDTTASESSPSTLTTPSQWTWDGQPPMHDWVATTDGTLLLSPRAKEALGRHTREADAVRWIPANISTKQDQGLKYYVPSFPNRDTEILDTSATTWGPSGLPIRWVLAGAAILQYRVFKLAFLSTTLIVHHSTLAGLESAAIAGYSVSRARIN